MGPFLLTTLSGGDKRLFEKEVRNKYLASEIVLDKYELGKFIPERKVNICCLKIRPVLRNELYEGGASAGAAMFYFDLENCKQPSTQLCASTAFYNFSKHGEQIHIISPNQPKSFQLAGPHHNNLSDTICYSDE